MATSFDGDLLSFWLRRHVGSSMSVVGKSGSVPKSCDEDCLAMVSWLI